MLRQMGWDVTIGKGEVIASREDRWGAWTLAVDGSGRILVTVTRPLRPARARRVQRGERTYRTLWEEHGIFSVSTEVSTPRDLPQVLEQLPALLRQARLKQDVHQ